MPINQIIRVAYVVHDFCVEVRAGREALRELYQEGYRPSNFVLLEKLGFEGGVENTWAPMSYRTPAGDTIGHLAYDTLVADRAKQLAEPRLWLPPAKLSAQ